MHLTRQPSFLIGTTGFLPDTAHRQTRHVVNCLVGTKILLVVVQTGPSLQHSISQRAQTIPAGIPISELSSLEIVPNTLQKAGAKVVVQGHLGISPGHGDWANLLLTQTKPHKNHVANAAKAWCYWARTHPPRHHCKIRVRVGRRVQH